nr:paternally-expressed gene 3 protein-like isoform X1 [Megalopta genalis]
MQVHFFPVVAMRLYLILGLLFAAASAEKKINLEDIERDNLRAEGISKSGVARPEATNYLTKPEISQQQYQLPGQYNRPPNAPVAYAAPPSGQNVKRYDLQYSRGPPRAAITANIFPQPPESYDQPGRYVAKDQVYQQQQNTVLPEQSPPPPPPPQYFIDYQQPSATPPKEAAPNYYEPQQLIYQPEVIVGNQMQTVQQKTVTAKYAQTGNKETVYVDIPMMHLLTYYPNLDVNSGKTRGLLVPQLSTAGSQQISIPVYTSALSQKPIVPVKPTYQIQYTPKHNADVPTTFTAKPQKSSVYASPVTPKKYTSAPLVNAAAYVQPDQSYAQGRQFLYTQAYVAQSQPQYVSQLVYAQPAAVYMHATPVYSDVYARTPAYAQDNGEQGNVKYSEPPEQSETATEPLADELPNQVLAQQASQSVSQNYVKDPEEPNENLVPPQLPAQEFKTGVTSLLPVPSQEDESVPVQNHVGPSEPRSLLDSYVPSKLIAAQDSARYEERPIKLESGFLPSKENFLYKKLKTVE